MDATTTAEATLSEANSVLVTARRGPDGGIAEEFFGSDLSPEDLASGSHDLPGKTVYLCGNVSAAVVPRLETAERVFVVRESGHGGGVVDSGHPWPVVDPGRMPTRVHGLGVYYPRFFDPAVDYFGRVCAEHAFQALTESTKPGTAHRTGIYLTPVRQDTDGLHFRLLRCSTNLAGPTENFRATDRGVVDALNREAGFVFRGHAPLNHVLAQVYHNTPGDAGRKPARAKISAHADKTKDMPGSGVLAFCTFYDRLDGLRPLPDDPFDYGRNGVSGLTRLHFRLKDPVADRPGCRLPPQFTLTLYPGSVFFMPLSTNRLYTHETRPPALDARLLPTRLGYVVRCSRAEAVHANGHTYLEAGGSLAKLVPPMPEGVSELRRLYAAENTTADVIEYGDRFPFSLNAGDYLAPRL